MALTTKYLRPLAIVAASLAMATGPANSAPDAASRNAPDGGAPRHAPDGAPRHAPGAAPRHATDGVPRLGPGGAPRSAPGGPAGAHGARPHADGQRWYDGAHGHGRYYPAPGWGVRTLPPRSRVVFWSGVNYGFFDGIWYAPGPHGYAVVRPPFGVVVSDLPAFRTLLVIGGIAYLYANGVYYRERSEGGYEVVPAPVAADAGGAAAIAARMFVYPRLNQSAEQQATDEYDCHRWAVSQSSFDPTLAATAPAGADFSRRGDYQRARSACLEGRNYTVR